MAGSGEKWKKSKPSKYEIVDDLDAVLGFFSVSIATGKYAASAATQSSLTSSPPIAP